MARLNCYVPDELKARMDAAGDRIGWSEIACRAFEGALARDGKIYRSETDSPIDYSRYGNPILSLENTVINIDGQYYKMTDLIRRFMNQSDT